MDRGVWRRRSDDPTTLLGWMWTGRERQLRPTRHSLGCFAMVGVIALFATGYPLAALGLTVVILMLPRLQRKPRSVEPLLTLPLVAAAFACEVDVSRDGVVVGTDRGAVTFLDGWLHYEGYRTTFSLSRADVEVRKTNHLALREESGLEFRPDAKDARDFGSALDRWYRIDPAARGLSVLPPREIHPSGVARVWGDAIFAGAQVALVLGAIAVAFFAFQFSIWFVVLLGGPGELVDAMRTLRRFRAFATSDRTALANERKPDLGP